MANLEKRLEALENMKALTPLKAVRAKCLDCSGGQPLEVRLCPVVSCTLWPYRMGRRPKIAEQTEAKENGT